MKTTARAPILLMVQALVALSLAASAEAADAARKIQQGAEDFAARQPQSLQPYFRTLYLEGEHNAVLNFDYLGLAALEVGEYSIAEHAFDAAITRIETIYADNSVAKHARSLFAEEKVKDFKGEPYERAMTYFYRGILYTRTGDYQNARASFLSAEQQSMLSEQESYASTFGLMDYLAGWVSHCDGDELRAKDLKARAVSLQPDLFGSLPVDANFVGLVDAGVGPVKYGTGKYKELLAFRPAGPAPTITQPTALGLTLSPPVVAADLNWQATTRGGRPVDAVLNGKAQWKSNTESASSAITAVGYGTALSGISSNNQGLAQAGEIGMAVGMIGGLFARAMTPAADTRSWATLPAEVVLTAAPGQIGSASTLGFNADGASFTTSFVAHAGQCALSWGRTRPSLAHQLPAPVLTEAKHEAVNAQMRSTLESTFSGGERTEVAAARP